MPTIVGNSRERVNPYHTDENFQGVLASRFLWSITAHEKKKEVYIYTRDILAMNITNPTVPKFLAVSGKGLQR